MEDEAGGDRRCDERRQRSGHEQPDEPLPVRRKPLHAWKLLETGAAAGPQGGNTLGTHRGDDGPDAAATVGMDAAVGLGDPTLWKQAIDERLKAQK